MPAPVVTFQTPPTGWTTRVGRTIRIPCVAESDLRILSVKFFLNGNLIGEDTKFPYSIKYTPDTEGVHVLTCYAEDQVGTLGFSEESFLTVLPPLTESASSGWGRQPANG
jgi:Bacterial Ig domain